MCTSRLTLKEQKIFTFEEMHTQEAHAATLKICTNGLEQQAHTH